MSGTVQTWERVRLEFDGDVALLWLDHAPTRNALAWKLAREANEALGQLGNARALVITGAGKGFCSGGDMGSDVKEGQGFGDMLREGIEATVNPLMESLAALDIPVVIAANGAVAGAGVPLALSGDFTIAGSSTFFLTAFTNVGLALDAGASWVLPRLVGLARATEALMLSERIPAAKALEWGMIHKVVADEELVAEATALAKRLAAGPTRSYALIRKALRFAATSTYSQALAHEVQAQQIAGNSADCAEAVSAFLEKRPPVFTGK